MITVAVKEKGADPMTNAKLRMAIEKSHEANMPKDNVDRAIKKGGGPGDGNILEEFIYEAYGPSGLALIIEGITDNKNRALGEIKNVLNRHQGKLANQGSVLWLFNHIGVLEFDLTNANNKDDLELAAIELGAQDIASDVDEPNNLFIYTSPENLEKTKQNLEQKNFTAKSFSLDWQAKEPLAIDNTATMGKIDKLCEMLDELDDVNEIYSNLK